MNRRHFLMSSAGVLAAARHAMPSPNDTVRVACVGLRGRGKDHLKAYGRIRECRNRRIMRYRREGSERSRRQIVQTSGHVFRPAQASRRQIHRRNLHRHAESFSTRCRPFGAARRASMSMSRSPARTTCSKPSKLWRPHENTTGLVQQGSQSRSSPALQEAVQSMRDGLLGDVYMARGLCYKWRNTIGHTPVEPVPPGVDYDLVAGPGAATRVHARIVFTTTGTGSGTTAMATWETRAFMSWTSRAGAWA